MKIEHAKFTVVPKSPIKIETDLKDGMADIVFTDIDDNLFVLRLTPYTAGQLMAMLHGYHVQIREKFGK